MAYSFQMDENAVHMGRQCTCSFVWTIVAPWGPPIGSWWRQSGRKPFPFSSS